MTTQAYAQDWKEMYEKAARQAAEWKQNFDVLQRELVGDTGASGITVAATLRKDAERYRLLRDGQNWPAAFASANAPEPLRGVDLDAAIDGTEPMIDGWPMFIGLPPPATPEG